MNKLAWLCLFAAVACSQTIFAIDGSAVMKLKAKIEKNLNAKDEINSKIYSGASPAELVFDGKKVLVHFGSNKIYSTQGYFLKCFTMAVEIDGKLAMKNKFFKGDSGTISLSFSSSDENIMFVNQDGEIGIKRAGKPSLIISAGSQSYSIPFEIVELPISSESNQDEIIKKIGLPDYQKKIYIPWSKADLLDDIFYSPKAEEVNGKAVEHWKFNSYKNAIFRFLNGDKLTDVTCPEIEKLPTTKTRLEYGSLGDS